MDIELLYSTLAKILSRKMNLKVTVTVIKKGEN